MKYLWIGIGLSETLKDMVRTHHSKLMSGMVSQENWLCGLDSVGVDMDSINSCPFPMSVRRVPGNTWSRNGRSTDIHAGYRNGKYISRLTRRRALTRAAREWALAHRGEAVTVLVYSMSSPFLAAALEVKRVIPDARVCLIVLDLPQYMDMGMSRVKKALKALDWQYIRRALRGVDRYVLYSRHMAEFLHLRDGTWCVLEGSINEADSLDDPPVRPQGIIPVMYSGVTDLRYGIPELLDAFRLLEGDEYELWITGSGNAVPLIEERAAADPRIRFFGFLPSRRELLEKQHSAAMMINMRRPDEPASAYCFPSKLFEYMLSGNPVLSFRIPGIPEDYFNYLIPMEDTAPATVAAAIRRVAGMPAAERETLGERTRAFVLDNKNCRVQAERLIAFVGGKEVTDA